MSPNSSPPAKKTPVLIAGSGSAGICAGVWLSMYNIPYRILDCRSGQLEKGQADGVQCRTVEIFESFGLVDELRKEAYWVNEDVFWSDGSKDGAKREEHEHGGENTHTKGNVNKGIKRMKSVADTAPGLSHQPHVILNQARINGLLLDAMRKYNGQEVEYGKTITGVSVDPSTAGDPEGYPVTVQVIKSNGESEEIKAQYVIGCDGAHSLVRKSLGISMNGDSSNSLWGVMDVYPLTDFPDIRKKAVIRSSSGTLLIIPREGGSLVRFYIELSSTIPAKSVTLPNLHDAARAIFSPYKMEYAETHWWSAYSIGQRLASRFTDQDRVFLAGDACHTHSPKAGQGMNVSLQDGYNIGWKLSQILTGKVSPDLIQTYTLERHKVASTLIDFDRTWAKQMSAGKSIGADGQEEDFSETFVKAGRYTAGLTATYDDSPVTRAQWSDQTLAKELKVGMRFPSAQIVRFCDAKPMQFVNALPSDGKWRIVVFAGDIRNDDNATKLRQLGDYLYSSSNPLISKFTHPESDIDSFIETIVVLSGQRTEIEQESIPDCFMPVTGKWRMRDPHKIFIDDESYNYGHGHAYKAYGVSSTVGAVVIVRPDQYVSLVVGVEKYETLGKFFDGFALSQR